MRTTKNITVKENQVGFVVNNNFKTVCTVKTYAEAKAIASALAKKENKKAIANTDFFTERIY